MLPHCARAVFGISPRRSNRASSNPSEPNADCPAIGERPTLRFHPSPPERCSPIYPAAARATSAKRDRRRRAELSFASSGEKERKRFTEHDNAHEERSTYFFSAGESAE